jgi:hypothetical protein
LAGMAGRQAAAREGGRAPDIIHRDYAALRQGRRALTLAALRSGLAALVLAAVAAALRVGRSERPGSRRAVAGCCRCCLDSPATRSTPAGRLSRSSISTRRWSPSYSPSTTPSWCFCSAHCRGCHRALRRGSGGTSGCPAELHRASGAGLARCRVCCRRTDPPLLADFQS